MLIQLIRINIPQHLRVSIRIALGNYLEIHWCIDTTHGHRTSDELRVAARVSALIILNFFVCMVNGYPCGHREERRGFGDSVNIPMNAEVCAVFITQCPQCLKKISKISQRIMLFGKGKELSFGLFRK